MKKSLIAVVVILGVAALVIAAEESGSSGHQVFNAADLKWSPAPPGLPAGAEMAVLSGNPGASGAFTVRLKAPAGYTIKPHTHPTVERVTVISGDFKVGMGEKMDEAGMKKLAAGGYVVLPPNMAHYAKSDSQSIVQVDSEGPFQINYVNPADDPRGDKK